MFYIYLILREYDQKCKCSIFPFPRTGDRSTAAGWREKWQGVESLTRVALAMAGGNDNCNNKRQQRGQRGQRWQRGGRRQDEEGKQEQRQPKRESRSASRRHRQWRKQRQDQPRVGSSPSASLPPPSQPVCRRRRTAKLGGSARRRAAPTGTLGTVALGRSARAEAAPVGTLGTVAPPATSQLREGSSSLPRVDQNRLRSRS